MNLVQITDLHVTDPDDDLDIVARTTERLRIAVRAINGMRPRPDAVIATGDLVNHCRESEYLRLRDVLAGLEIPIYLMVGNHDSRDALRTVFPDHAYLGDGPFVHYVVDDLDVRLIALDSQKTGLTEGELCADRIAWLREQLDAAPDRPTMIFMHHPPFYSGIDRMDANGLAYGRDELADLLRGRTNVLRVLAGHVHRPILGQVGGVPAQTCSSTAHQLGLDLVRTDGVTIVQEPPACLVHTWGDRSGLVSHHVYLDEYPILADHRMS